MTSDPIKYIRVQIAPDPLKGLHPEDAHTVVEFLNGSRACSCGLERGTTPVLRAP